MMAFYRDFRTHPKMDDTIELPSESALTEYAEQQAGCGGFAFLDVVTGELFLCDETDQIKWHTNVLLKLKGTIANGTETV